MSDVTVTVPAEVQIIEITVPGEQGPAGPDPWLEPIQQFVLGGTPQVIDYSDGKHVRLWLNDNTAISFTGWPAANRIARLTLKIETDGNHQIDWPAGIYWEGGIEPTFTDIGRAWIILATDDGGATIDGFVSGLNHKPAI